MIAREFGKLAIAVRDLQDNVASIHNALGVLGRNDKTLQEDIRALDGRLVNLSEAVRTIDFDLVALAEGHE